MTTSRQVIAQSLRCAGVLLPNDFQDFRTYEQKIDHLAADIDAALKASKQRARTDYPKCRWCSKCRKPSNWEQQVLTSDEWARLCERCARRRLDNPWNALLAMRKAAL